jgi:hypothetical protein
MILKFIKDIPKNTINLINLFNTKAIEDVLPGKHYATYYSTAINSAAWT